MSKTDTPRRGWGAKIAAIGGAVVVGLVLGVGSAAGIARGGHFGAHSYDGWAGDPRIGSPSADPWTRAMVAKSGLLALNKAETIYFTRYKDEAGRALDAACSYRVEGGPMPARWWSVTLYAADDYLARNGDGAASVDATRAHLGPDRRWRALVGPQRAGAADWISARNAGRFSLTLRLYNPEPRAAADFASIPFPKLTRLSCVEGRA